LPATTYVPKEIMPLIDTPIINHLIWEACKAGVSRVHIVISPSKKEIISRVLEGSGNKWGHEIRRDLPRIALNPVPKGIEIIIHEQIHPGGVGDAISLAKKSIKGPFLVLLGDNLLISDHLSNRNSGPKHASNSSKKLVEYFEKNNIPCAGILEISPNKVDKYGIAEIECGLIKKIIEKPKLGESKSNYILCGRYLLPHNTDELLDLYPSSEYGELQSIELFNHFIENGGFGGIKMNEFVLYDSGDPLNWLKSQIDHALRRSDLEEFKKWIKERVG